MGYEVTRFIGEIDEEFLCSICAMVLENSVQTPCDHLFCSKCVNGWLSINKTCPVDRKALDITDLKPTSRTVRNLLSKLEIKCDFHSEGCNKIGKLESLQLHLITCEYNPDSEMVCDKGCNLKMSRADYQLNDCLTHLAVSHEKEIIKLIHELSNQKEHYERIVYRQQEEIKKLSDEVKRLYQMQEKYGPITIHQRLQNGNTNDESKNVKTSEWQWQVCHNMNITIDENDILERGDDKRDFGFAQSLYPLEPGNCSFKVQILRGQFISIGLTFKGLTTYSSKDYFLCYHVSDGQLEDQNISELIKPKCTTGDIIEFGIKFPPDFLANVGVGYVSMFLSINERIFVEKLFIMPNLQLYPSIGIWGDEAKVKYLGTK